MIAMKINKKNKKSYNTDELDLNKLSDELIQKPKQQFSKKDSKSDKRKRK